MCREDAVINMELSCEVCGCSQEECGHVVSDIKEHYLCCHCAAGILEMISSTVGQRHFDAAVIFSKEISSEEFRVG